MAEDKYSVILMRDDHTVRHYHFRSFWIRIILYSVFAILAASLLFGYVSVKLWLKTNHLKEINEKQLQQLQQKNVRLNRLENIEKVVAFRDPEQLEKLITGKLRDIYTDDAGTQVDLRRFYSFVDTKLFSISNLKAERIKDHSLALRFDLKNLQGDDSALRGRADVHLLTINAKLIEHSLSENNQIFQIKHYKTFNTTIRLPDAVDSNDIFALRISISGPQGKVFFGKAYRLDDLIP